MPRQTWSTPHCTDIHTHTRISHCTHTHTHTHTRFTVRACKHACLWSSYTEGSAGRCTRTLTPDSDRVVARKPPVILRVREEIGGIVWRCSTSVPGVRCTTPTRKLRKYLLCANGSSSQGDNPNPTTTLKTDENQNKIAILVGTTFHRAYNNRYDVVVFGGRDEGSQSGGRSPGHGGRVGYTKRQRPRCDNAGAPGQFEVATQFCSIVTDVSVDPALT